MIGIDRLTIFGKPLIRVLEALSKCKVEHRICRYDGMYIDWPTISTYNILKLEVDDDVVTRVQLQGITYTATSQKPNGEKP